MLKIAAIAVAVLVVAILLFAATRPGTFRVERTVNIEAPPEKIFPLIDELRNLEAWSPWEKVDPAVKRTYSGAAAGVGAVYEWTGNKDIGQGRMEIVESIAPSSITLKLDFVKPFEAHNILEYTLQTQGDATKVTQAMHGPCSYMSKLIGVFIDTDRMIGDKFEEGLLNLKSIAEK
jgi:hypothetical protein